MELGIEREFFILRKGVKDASSITYDEFKRDLIRKQEENPLLKSKARFLDMTAELDPSMIEFRGRCGDRLENIKSFLYAQELAMQSIEQALSVSFSPHSLIGDARYAQNSRIISTLTDILGYLSSTHIHFGTRDEEDAVRIYNKLKHALFEKRILPFIFASTRVALLMRSFPSIVKMPELHSFQDAREFDNSLRYVNTNKVTPFLRIRPDYQTVELRILDSTHNIEILSEQISTIAKLA